MDVKVCTRSCSLCIYQLRILAYITNPNIVTVILVRYSTNGNLSVRATLILPYCALLMDHKRANRAYRVGGQIHEKHTTNVQVAHHDVGSSKIRIRSTRTTPMSSFGVTLRCHPSLGFLPLPALLFPSFSLLLSPFSALDT